VRIPALRAVRVVSRWDARIVLIPPDVAVVAKQDQPEDRSRTRYNNKARPFAEEGGPVSQNQGWSRKPSADGGGPSTSNGNGWFGSLCQTNWMRPRGTRLRGGRSIGIGAGGAFGQRRSAGAKWSLFKDWKGFMGRGDMEVGTGGFLGWDGM
jgi:hypothetical protein